MTNSHKRRARSGIAAAIAMSTVIVPLNGAVAGGDGLVWGGSGHDWSGFYAGLHGGAGIGSGIVDRDPGDERFKGYLFGGHAGYMQQYGHIVFGVEASHSFSDITSTDSRTSFDQGTGNGFTFTTREDDKVRLSHEQLGHLQTRIGLGNGTSLVYLSGGLAWTQATANIQYFDSYSDSRGLYRFNDDHLKSDDWLIGWTIGGGGEYRLSDRLSIGFQVQYYSFDQELDYTRVFKIRNNNMDEVRRSSSYWLPDLSVIVGRAGMTYHMN